MEISTRPIGLKYGAILGMLSMIYSSALFLTGSNNNMALGLFFYVIMGAVIFFGFKEFKKYNDDYMSFGQGFQLSLWINLVLSAVSAVFTYVYIDVFDPTILQSIQNQQIAALEKQGMSDEQIEETMKIASTFMTPSFMAVTVFLTYMFIGLIIGAVLSLIVKKNRPEFE